MSEKLFTTTPSCTLEEIYGDLPPDKVPDDVNLDEIAKVSLKAIKDLRREDLVEDVIWRDWLSLSGRAQTFCGTDEVLDLWKRCIARKQIEKVEVTSQMPMRPCAGTSWVSIGISFNTVQDNGLTGHHTGFIGMVPTTSGDWKIWTIVTVLETFEGYGHPDQPQIEPSNRKLLCPDGVDYAVAIIGGGQAGIGLAGRLKALDIPAIVIERAHIVGSVWSNRYDYLRQHTDKEYNNLPFDRTYRLEDDNLVSGKIVAERYKDFVEKYRIEVWTSCEATSCIRDDDSGTWTIELVTRTKDGKTQSRTIKSRHLVAANGAGLANVKPLNLPRRETFQGTILHQDQFRNAKQFTGKRSVIIGTGTSGHDIAQDCFDNNMNVTMIQRSKTPVFPVEWVDFSQLWNRQIPTAMSDRIGSSGPHKVRMSIARRVALQAAEQPQAKNFFDDLEKAGFKVARDTTIGDIFSSAKWGTFHIDVGTSKHIINGDIKVKSGVPIKTLTEHGVLFEDGEELPADLIVTATGYEPDNRRTVAPLIGEDMAGKLPQFWGTTKNGDNRGFAQELRPGFWMLGGGADMVRWIGTFVALQIMLDLAGVNNVIY